MTIWTEGVCADGAAILRDGEMVPIEEVLRTLNASADEIERLRAALRELSEAVTYEIEDKPWLAEALIARLHDARQALKDPETVTNTTLAPLNHEPN